MTETETRDNNYLHRFEGLAAAAGEWVGGVREIQ